jgi:hypothetical protein
LKEKYDKELLFAIIEIKADKILIKLIKLEDYVQIEDLGFSNKLIINCKGLKIIQNNYLSYFH